MFQFPGLPPRALCVQAEVTGHGPCRVPPFGHPRVEGCVPLTAAFRSLPRPSSASCAKASAVRPEYLLIRIYHHKCFFAVLRVVIACAIPTSVSLGDLKRSLSKKCLGNNRISIRSSIREEDACYELPAIAWKTCLLLLARDMFLF